MKYGIMVIALLLAGCASQKPTLPSWVTSPKERYPLSQYLFAAGQGDSRRAAENSAAAGLARIFESNIQADETLTETTTESRGKNETFDQFSELRSGIRIGTQQDLLNIRFSEPFTDARGRVHIVAFLARAETSAIYQERVGNNARDAAQLIARGETETDPVDRYAFLRAAVRLAIENDRLLAQLDVINLQARKTMTLGYDAQTLYTRAAAAARAVTFSVDLPSPAKDAIREALTGMGFSESENAELQFSGNTEFAEADIRRDSLVFTRCSYSLEARRRTGEIILVLNGSFREGHINLQESSSRAERTLRTKLLSDIPRSLGGVFDRLAAAN